MFYLHILGDPSLTGPGGPVTGRAAYKRRIALLALLALARGRPVGRERIIGLLWPEHPAEAARRTLSESLYVLRKELGEDVFTAPGDEVGLNAAIVACDAAEFEAALEAGELERAAGLYGGPLLDGFYVADAPDFERWVDGERDRLARAYARALESLAERARAEGSALRAVDWWRRLAAHEPYSGRVALRLMQALDAAGERVAALRAAETHAMLLRGELELEPDPEVTDYVERLRTEPARAPAPPPPAAPAAPAPSADPSSIPAADPEPEPRPAEDAISTIRAAETPAVAAAADAAPDIHPPAPPPPPPADAPAATAAPSPAAPVRHRRRSWMLAGALGMAGVLAVAFGVWLGGRGDAAKDAAAGHDPRRIAVLYFDDHSAGGQLQYLANGLTEMLIHELSQVPALDVVSRNGVKPFRDGRTPLDGIVAALRAGSVVEGSVQRLGDSVRVVVQLIDAASQSHLESRTVTRPASDGPALEDALAQEVSAFLRRRLGETVALRQTRGETRSAAAHELVLRAEQLRDDAGGLAEMQHAGDQGSAVLLLNRADSLLARAQAADPGWTRPRVLRALVAYSLADRAPSTRQEAL
ncbi:MAG TPA: BTAD domain-containing putative transcriptional regulator, partial [Longimicrobium sp.]